METLTVRLEGSLSVNHRAIAGEHEPTLLKNPPPPLTPFTFGSDFEASSDLTAPTIKTRIMGDMLMNRLVLVSLQFSILSTPLIRDWTAAWTKPSRTAAEPEAAFSSHHFLCPAKLPIPAASIANVLMLSSHVHKHIFASKTKILAGKSVSRHELAAID